MQNCTVRCITKGTTQSWSAVCAASPLLGKYRSPAHENAKREFHDVVGTIITPSRVRGIDHLRDPRLNKGLAFTLEERQALGIHGLQPPRYKSQDEQIELCKVSFDRYKEDLNKYLYLSELSDRNEKLFFRLISENVETMLPIVYTPTVGLACQRFGHIYRRPRGLFITINDKCHVFDVIRNWPEPEVKAICVTDGERILGLGDLGASGMGIPIGKLALYTALAGIKPHQCLPIMLDVGTNNIKLLEDSTYIGLRQKRVSGPEYDDFLDEFMEAVVARYGQTTLIQFEDFGQQNAFRLLDKYRNKYCTFNDDIQGTASVIVAGLYSVGRLLNRKMSENTFMFLGAGGAALGIADLIVRAMQDEGLPLEEARSRIWMMDIDGLLVKDRPEGNLEGNRIHYAKNFESTKSLLTAVQKVKPSVLIGASAVGGAFTPEVLREMSANNARPVIFALSNPTSKAECTAEEAYINTEGRCVFSSGSPFPPVEYNGTTYKTGQGNNAYIFPGVALGVLAAHMLHITEDVFLLAARTVAENVKEEQFSVGNIYPNLNDIREVSLQIATKVTQLAFDKGLAGTYPEPQDKRCYISSMLYNFDYEDSLPTTYQWPKGSDFKPKKLEPTLINRHL